MEDRLLLGKLWGTFSIFLSVILIQQTNKDELGLFLKILLFDSNKIIYILYLCIPNIQQYQLGFILFYEAVWQVLELSQLTCK